MDNMSPDTINISSVQTISKEPSIRSQMNPSIKSQSPSVLTAVSNALNLPTLPLEEEHIRTVTDGQALPLDKTYGKPTTKPTVPTDNKIVETQNTIPVVPSDETYTGSPTNLPSVTLDRSDPGVAPNLTSVSVNNTYVTSPTQRDLTVVPLEETFTRTPTNLPFLHLDGSDPGVAPNLSPVPASVHNTYVTSPTQYGLSPVALEETYTRTPTNLPSLPLERSDPGVALNLTPVLASVNNISETSPTQHAFSAVPSVKTYTGTPPILATVPLHNSNPEVESNLTPVSFHVKNANVTSPPLSVGSPNGKEKLSDKQSFKSLIIKPEEIEKQGKNIKNQVENLTEVIKRFSKTTEDSQSPQITSNIDKIANMSRVLTNEANALRKSIKSLSDDIARTKQEISSVKEEDVNFPYHLFLVEIIINKIHMKCECFDIDYNNLIIAATFLGKQPIILYDGSYGKIDNFSKLNVGKSTLFAMTYDKICSIQEFEVVIQLTKQPPCSSCVTKIGETRMDCTKEFVKLREELCKKWIREQPNDNIICTTSTPLSKNLYYLSCGDNNLRDSIGVIEVTTRMSFLGKEITTTFCTSPKPQGTSFLSKEDNGMSMYSCQKVEMDDQGKILLEESSITRKPLNPHSLPAARDESRTSQISSITSSRKSYHHSPYYHRDGRPKYPKYNEIFTKMNANELKIRLPKSSKFERMGKYDKIQELCSCESTSYNAGEQIQFELPKDLCNTDKSHNTYTSNLKYTYNGCDKSCDKKDRKIINITPTNCPAPVAMEKILHPQKDVFILKIGKKMETKDKKTDLEIELVTPKAPSDRYPENVNNSISQQCSSSEIKAKSPKVEKKNDKTKNKGKHKKVGQKKKRSKK